MRKLLRLAEIVQYAIIFVVVPVGVIFYSGGILFGISRDSAGISCQATQFERYDVPSTFSLAIAGLAWGDVDNDGWDDLFVASLGSRENSSRLYKNIGGELHDRTEEWGLPELAASSGMFADFDNDGLLDLFAVEARPSTPFSTQTVRVFHNANGEFAEVTEVLGFGEFETEGRLATLAFADFDNDGFLDVVASFFGPLRYYPPAELKDPVLVPTKEYGYRTSKFICDSGDLARVMSEEPSLANSPDGEVVETMLLARGGCIYAAPSDAPPGDYQPSLSRKTTLWALVPGALHVFKNNSGSGFADIGEVVPPAYGRLDENAQTAPSAPWPHLTHKYHQALAFDFDGDGLQDLFLTVDGGRNLLLRNEGDFVFRDVSAENDLEIFGTGMGVALGDPLRTGKLDHLMVTNVGKAFLFRGRDGVLELDQNFSLNRTGFGWGIAFLDAENDGFADLSVANGTYGVSGETSRGRDVFISRLYGEELTKDRFYENQKGFFVDRTDSHICTDDTNVRALAVADVNGGGYEDMVIGTVNPAEEGGLALFLNKGGNNHYLKVGLRGTQSNSFGVGAVITVIRADGSRQSQLVAIGESYNSQHSLRKTFGLGESAEDVSVEVRWPSGIFQRVSSVAADSTVILEEPAE